ncbi:MAG: hypothetical protein LBC37_01605 [Zoogloeaceae bacterium]|jgi:hypothetical protein|nr:hypothetical protein [Zoogloeaceae bacterium]
MSNPHPKTTPKSAPKTQEPAAKHEEKERFLEEVVGDLDALARETLASDMRVRIETRAQMPNLQFPDLEEDFEFSSSLYSGGLLGQLREQAQDILNQQEARARQNAQLAARIDQSMRYVLAWLQDMTQQLNIIKPEIPRDYLLADEKCLQGLAWRKGSTDYRVMNPTSELSLMHSVSLNYRLKSEMPDITLKRNAPTAEEFRQRFFDLNLNMLIDETYDTRQALKTIHFRIAQEVQVRVRWEPDYQEEQIVVRASNLERLGNAIYRMPIEAPRNPALMEEFGRMVLGASHHFPRINQSPNS